MQRWRPLRNFEVQGEYRLWCGGKVFVPKLLGFAQELIELSNFLFENNSCFFAFILMKLRITKNVTSEVTLTIIFEEKVLIETQLYLLLQK